MGSGRNSLFLAQQGWGGYCREEQWDLIVGKPDSPGWQVSYQSNELLKAFESLRILRYEETTAQADWSFGADALLVRLLAQRR